MGRRGLAATGGIVAVAAVALVALLAGGGDDGGDGDTSLTEAQAQTYSTGPGEGAPFSADEAGGIAATLAAIDSGGELPYEQDGSSFQNREGLLPDEPGGYYREYTVETPGSDDRGARRLVIGEQGETFYTRDHYNSFIRIDPQDFR